MWYAVIRGTRIMTPKPSRSIRIDEKQDEFIRNNEKSLSEVARKAIDDERIRQAVGVCAVCGSVLYTHGDSFTTFGGSSPAGQRLRLENSECVDLCETHSEEFMEVFSQDLNNGEKDESYPDLEYIDSVYNGNVKAYMLEVRAVMDSQPDREYSDIVTNRFDSFDSTASLLSKYHRYLLMWLNDDRASRNSPETGFNPEEEFFNTIFQFLPKEQSTKI